MHDFVTIDSQPAMLRDGDMYKTAKGGKPYGAYESVRNGVHVGLI